MCVMEKNVRENLCVEKNCFERYSSHYQGSSKKGNSRGNESRLYLHSEKRQRISALYDLILEFKSSLQSTKSRRPITLGIQEIKWVVRLSFPKKEIAGETKMGYIYLQGRDNGFKLYTPLYYNQKVAYKDIEREDPLPQLLWKQHGNFDFVKIFHF